MKISILSDTHFGVRNDNGLFLTSAKRFFDGVFFPTLEQRGISHIIHLGDLVDRRKYINFSTLEVLKKSFLEPLVAGGYFVDFLIGNHDVYYKNTNSLNALSELDIAAMTPKFRVFTGPYERTIDGSKVLYIPWINEENKDESFDYIRHSKAQICMGHLELTGYEMYKGSVSTHGYDKREFEKFDIVLSGHYHHRSTDGTVWYVGCPYEMTWADYHDPKGFHIFDTVTRELEFIENPNKMFSKFLYDDTDLAIEDVLAADYSEHKDTYVKLIVRNKTNPFIFDTVVEQFEKTGVFDLQIVEDNLNMDKEGDEDIISEAEDTPTILRKYVDSLKTPHADALAHYLTSLYNDALTVE